MGPPGLFYFWSGLVAWPGWVPAQPIVLCTLVNARMDTSNFVDLSCKPDIGIIDPELSVPNTSIFEKKMRLFGRALTKQKYRTKGISSG